MAADQKTTDATFDLRNVNYSVNVEIILDGAGPITAGMLVREIERLRALVEELRWQRDHALQCVECAEMGDGCGEIATRMLA